MLKLKIDAGTEKRQLVAGLAQHYNSDVFVGKKIIVLMNLEEATIMGVKAEGMFLAADNDNENVKLLTIDGNLLNGSEVNQ